MSFDLRVHVRDPKSGRVAKSNPYRYHVGRDGTFYERDGVWYTPDGVVVEKPAIASAPVSAPVTNKAVMKKDERIPTGHVQLD
jgi:hypothetical protein